MHRGLLELEREVREAELGLQARRARLQKMAEVLSANVNRALVDGIGQARLQFVPRRAPGYAG